MKVNSEKIPQTDSEPQSPPVSWEWTYPQRYGFTDACMRYLHRHLLAGDSVTVRFPRREAWRVNG